mgnify:CR=1 FL=1
MYTQERRQPALEGICTRALQGAGGFPPRFSIFAGTQYSLRQIQRRESLPKSCKTFANPRGLLLEQWRQQNSGKAPRAIGIGHIMLDLAQGEGGKHRYCLQHLAFPDRQQGGATQVISDAWATNPADLVAHLMKAAKDKMDASGVLDVDSPAAYASIATFQQVVASLTPQEKLSGHEVIHIMMALGAAGMADAVARAYNLPLPWGTESPELGSM